MQRLAFASFPLAAFAGLASLGLAACETAGERAATGQCPDGEVCSTKTPKGLHFRGPDYADDWIADATVKPTALGGVQTISILDAEDELPLAYAYTARLDNSDLSADAPDGASLTLHGDGAGTTMLHIDDATNGDLFDQLDVSATAIASADVVAFHDEQLLATDPPPAVMMGTGVQLMARLWDSSGIHRIVDQSLAISVTGQDATPMTWDTVALTPNAVGDIGVALTAGGAQRAAGAISVVDVVDSVAPGWTSFDPTTTPPRANQSLVACVEARHQGAPVVGLTWTISVQGADSTSPWVASNCVNFMRSTAGTVTIHGDLGGISGDFAIDVGAAQFQKTVANAASWVPRGPTPGDYAATFE